MDRYAEPQVTANPSQSIGGVLDDANVSAMMIHELMDDLEDRLLGPRPRPASETPTASKDAVSAPHPGIRASAETVAHRANQIVGRLNDLLGQL